MPLTHHLQAGAELGDWLRDQAGQTLRPYAARIADTAAAVTPLRPSGQPGVEHYATVGAIVDARLALAVQQAPPYAALLGALSAGLLDNGTAGMLATDWPTHAREHPDTAAMMRPTPDGPWQIAEPVTRPGARPRLSVRAAFDELRKAATETEEGQLASQRQEAEIAALLATVQGLEQVYRSGEVPATLQTYLDTGQVTHPPELLADAIQTITTQEHALAAATARGGYAPVGYATPVIVPSWAEGDLLLGPRASGGSTLVEVKTVTRVSTDKALSWLLQLAAYALLDQAGRWCISRIGVWLPRHRLLLDYALAELADTLRVLRPGLLDRAARAIRADGRDPDTLLTA